MNDRQTSAYYTVKKGDTLYKIAQTYKTTPQQLIQWNQLQNDLLMIGQVLLVAPASFPTPEHVGEDICKGYSSYEEKTEQEKYDSYIVQRGDSLYKIARQFHTDIGTLSYLNHLTNTLLTVGQVLKIPKGNTSNQTIYQVQAGDSLWSIASKYGISVSELQRANQLSNTLLAIGQTLIIPPKVSSPNITSDQYIVKAGDSLWSIANRYGVTVDFLMRRNGLTNTLLTVGQVLFIT